MTEFGQASTWSHRNTVELVCGATALARLDTLPQRRFLLVTTPGTARRGLAERLARRLPGSVELYADVLPNPTVTMLEEARRRWRGEGIEGLIGLGGGSAVDFAKSLAVLLADPAGAGWHARLIQDEQSWSQALPVVAVPTTAGTGAEVTPFATVWDFAAGRKLSMAGERLQPRLALLDPALTFSLPAEQTLYTALDALSHALESLWNRRQTPLSRAYALQALALIGASLPVALAHPDALAARADLQQGSLLAGLAIAQTRTALAHSISYPLTLRFGVPHGLACSFTLPRLLEANLAKLARYSHERELLDGILTLLRTLELPRRLRAYASRQEILALRAHMHTPGRADNYLFEPPDIADLLEDPD